MRRLREVRIEEGGDAGMTILPLDCRMGIKVVESGVEAILFC